MDAQELLNQLLESGKKLAAQGAEKGSELAVQGKQLAEQGLDYATDKLNLPEAGPERDNLMKNLGIGAAAGGILAMLVGTKTGRKVLSPAIKLGSLAALGGIGYKVYTEWQKSQGAEATGQPIGELAAPAANARSLAIVKAMIAAAKSDGSIDAAEQALISGKIKASDLNDDAADILLSEIQKPLNIAEVAASADSPESAVEIYLASLLVTDQTNASERRYLNELSQALQLDPNLIRNLEAEVLAPA